MKYVLSFILTALCTVGLQASHKTHASTESTSSEKLILNESTLEEVVEIKDGLFSAEGTTAAGEKIFFIYERLDTLDQRTAWQKYFDTCFKLVENSDGWLYRLGTYSDNKKDLKKLRKEEQFSDMKSSKFKALTKIVRKKGLYPNGKKWEQLNGIRGGMWGFEPKLCHYVAYISTKPVTAHLAETVDLADSTTSFENAIKKYESIIMSVGSTLSNEKPIYENRGIFRNPAQLFQDTYCNVSGMLHFFTIKAMHLMNQNPSARHMQYLITRPLPKMKEILEKQLGEKNKHILRVGNDIPEELREYPAGGFGVLDIPMLADISEVIALHEQEEDVLEDNFEEIAPPAFQEIAPTPTQKDSGKNSRSKHKSAKSKSKSSHKNKHHSKKNTRKKKH